MKIFKKMLLSLSIISLSFPIIASGCSIKNEIEYKNYEEISKIFSSLKLGSEIVTNAKTVKVIFNNFGFFGGSDISADIYDWYKDDGYKNQIELFEIYQKWKGPYDLQGEYANVKYTYGKRGFFDFSHSNYTIKNAVEIFDGVTKENDILTTIYNIDTDDVLNVNENDFKTYLKLFIDKSLLLRNNTGMVIIKNHYYTNDNEFNKRNSLVNNYIKEVIVENYKNDQSKLNRINFVDHTNITQNNPFVLNQDQKFVDFCLTQDNKLNAYGNLEMVYDLIKTVYPESVDPPIQNISLNLLENNKPNHKITGDNKYIIPYSQQSNKVNNFQKYLSNLNKANWYFLGDSITAGSMNTKGYKTYVDYLKSLIKTDLKRPNDLIVNGAVYGGNYRDEYNFKDVLFTKYKIDVMSVLLGTNDLVSINQTTIDTEAAKYITEKITMTYDYFKKSNPNGWMFVLSIPCYYNSRASDKKLQEGVKNANNALKEFADSKEDVLYIDVKASIDYVVKNNFNNEITNTNLMVQIFDQDLLHFNTSGHIIFTKQILTNIGFDYSKSKFMNF